MDDDIFQVVRSCFEEDDGSLPGVELNCLSAEQVAGVYAYVRERSQVSTQLPEF